MTGPLIALTGATGFIGRHLLAELPQARLSRPRAAAAAHGGAAEGATGAVIGDIASPQNMAAALRGVDAVIHSAGLAHAMSGRPEDDYRTINTRGDARARPRRREGACETLRVPVLDPGPERAGVGLALTEADEPAPDRCRTAAPSSRPSRASPTLGIDWVALRPVLVYGPGVKGNMAALAGPRPLAAGRCPSAALPRAALPALPRKPDGGRSTRC